MDHIVIHFSNLAAASMAGLLLIIGLRHRTLVLVHAQQEQHEWQNSLYTSYHPDRTARSSYCDELTQWVWLQAYLHLVAIRLQP